MNQEFIKFEADVPRQHARYRLPLKCIIGDHLYQVYDWSVSGLSIEAVNTSFMINKPQQIALVFPFDGYDFVVSVDAVAERGQDADRVEFRYVNIDAARLRLFRYVLDGYLAGEIMTAGEILDVSRREADTPKPAKAAAALDRSPIFVAGQALRFLMVAAITVGLAAFVSLSLAQRFGTIPTESAAVALESTPLVTLDAGVLTNVVSGDVSQGQLVATITTPSQNTATLFSPCDCIVSNVQATIGSTVAPGDQIATLQASDGAPYVQAWLRRDRIMDLYRGVTAEVELYDGAVIRNVPLTQLPTVDASAPAPSDLVPVRLDLPETFTGLQANQPVTVRFIRTNMLGGFLAGLGNWFTGLLA